MIENLRKYTGLIIVVIALLFVGLAFLGDGGSMNRGNPGDPPAISIDGRTYSYTEYQKGSAATRQLAIGLGLYEFVSTMGGFGNDEQANQLFFANHIFLKQACEEFGVRPSDEQVATALQAMPTFQGPDRSYDQSVYNEFISKGIGRFGMTEQDVIELVRDSLATSKLSEILGGGLSPNRSFAAEQVISRDQQVTIQLARVSLDKFKESLDPTDEELEAEWATTKDKYTTEAKVKVSYIIAAPTYPEPEKETPKLPEAVTEEDKKAAAEKEAQDKATAAAKLAETKRQIDNELIDIVDTFVIELQDEDGNNFEKLAAANNWEIVTTEFFPRSAPPAELAIKRESSSDPRPIADFLFQLVADGESLARFTDALPIADGRYIIARLDELEESRTKTFEEAKEEVRSDYITEKSGEALKKDSDEKAEKIRAELAAGKSFADAAKEVDLEVKSHGPFKATDKLDGEADTATLFETASMVAPGTLADPVLRPDGALFVYVENREIVKDPNRDSRIEQSLTSIRSSQERIAFAAWLNDRLENTVITDLQR